MQLGLATDQFKANAPYMTAAYGFSVFAILGPLISGGVILLALVILVAINWKFQKDKSAKRFKRIDILKIEMFSLVCARPQVATASQHHPCTVCIQVWEKR